MVDAGFGAGSYLRTVATLYSSWRVIVMNVVLFGLYYLVLYWTITGSNSGYFLITIPYYLFLLLVLSSSVLATVATSYFRLSRRTRSFTGVVQSPLGVAVGAVAASCSCSIPLLGPVLLFLGGNALEVSGVISFLARYQEEIIVAVVVLDLLAVGYYVRALSRSGSLPARIG
jgi:hypothetical protein